MRSENILRLEAMDALVEKLGLVDAERFIDLIKKDTFNYTKWRKNLWKNKTLSEIYEDAVETYNKQK
jgi:hypothetical protein